MWSCIESTVNSILQKLYILFRVRTIKNSTVGYSRMLTVHHLFINYKWILFKNRHMNPSSILRHGGITIRSWLIQSYLTDSSQLIFHTRLCIDSAMNLILSFTNTVWGKLGIIPVQPILCPNAPYCTNSLYQLPRSDITW